MRGAGIGLLSLLVVVAIIMFAMMSGPGGGYVPTVLNKGKQGQDEAQQISGRTASGRPVSESAKFDPVEIGGECRRVKVLSMDADCPLLVNYHMQPGDEISQIGDLGVRDNNDFKLSVARIDEAWGRMEPITYERGGTTMVSRPDGPLQQTGVFQPAGVTTRP